MPAVTIDVVQASPVLEHTDMMYRLGYVDPQQARPYSQARWSMSPTQLVRQRLRGYLGQRHTVLNPGELTPSGTAAATEQRATLELRVELEEFSQLFSTPKSSTGVLRLRATVTQGNTLGEQQVLQRHLIIQRPAPTPDAAGGVRAMIMATDAAAQELDNWLQEIEAH